MSVNAQVEAVVKEIVTEFYANELTAFEAAGSKAIEDAFEGRTESVERSDIAFSVDGEMIVTFLKIILATVEIVKVLLPPKANRQVADVQEKWESELTKQGIERKKAKEISRKFSKELLEAAK